MSGIEVDKPIINSPYIEPQQHWLIKEGETPKLLPGRRKSVYYFRPPNSEMKGAGIQIELKLVNLIRERVAQWRAEGYPNATAMTLDLLKYWRRDGRPQLFYAQLEAVETVIFLVEARSNLLQGLTIPLDEPSEDARANGIRAFTRYACKMATGTGKTTVMGMLAAWSILNKINHRADSRFSDVVLVVVPNVTIRNRVQELDPNLGEASLYRTRDLVSEHLMNDMRAGRVLVTNWHIFERQISQAGGVSAKVVKTGQPKAVTETIHIGAKTTTARGKRYLSLDDYNHQTAAGILEVRSENRDDKGNLKGAVVESIKRVESDTAWQQRVLGRDVGGKKNILVMNDEAHHAYRLRPKAEEAEAEDEEEEEEEDQIQAKEATVWVDGLDLIHKHRGINICVDLSATPYFLGGIGGRDANKPFPWVVSDFGLVDAIESGLVKIPQMAVRDTTGDLIPGYFNVWEWILRRLTAAERGGKKGSPKPEAILKYAHTPIAILGGDWETWLKEWADKPDEPRPPVFILVVKNTAIAKVLYEWLAEGKAPANIPPSKLDEFRNNGRQVTIRVDSKVIHEGDTEGSKGDEVRWMRITLDTVGLVSWPTDSLGRPIYPQDFEALSKKYDRPLHPPGRDIRCIVSVGMLTEGWDCRTVTHIVGVRPFMSQLLCEQVVGRGLRRASYEVGDDGLMTEEVARIFGVPFEIIPFKADPKGAAPRPKPNLVQALPERAHLEIKYPRVEGYVQAVKNRVTVNWDKEPVVTIDPGNIPPEVQMKAALPNNEGRRSLIGGPGKLESVSLNPFRSGRRVQELVFELATALTRDWINVRGSELPAHVLFPQMATIAGRFIKEKVEVLPPGEKVDLFLSPYYGWVIEKLVEAIRPDTDSGESPELPQYELNRGPGSTADVHFNTSKDVRDVVRSHLNRVVADTLKWEQAAAYYIDTHPKVESFVKNDHLGFAIPYFHNGELHDYLPDFIVRFTDVPSFHLILETKGHDPLEGIKRDAALRWVTAVNAEASYGKWDYQVAKKPTEVVGILEQCSLKYSN
ncbi:MAG: BPTD_3080 family restriction endonuclease [Candidatus Sumerlaeaceae bacterium]